MGHAVPAPSEMFSDARGVDVARRFETYKGALAAEHTRAAAGGRSFIPGQGIVATGQADAINARIDTITKSLTPDQLAGLNGELAAIQGITADLGKDWTTTAPNATGLVPYDLEAPAKLLVPRLTPLRNSIPRSKGQGTARLFKRILGWSNSGVGGVADQSPFLNSNSVQTSFGSLALRRGAKINYASDNKSVIYKESGLSDQVNWQAQFAGQGFQDIRALSQTALLWASMGGEERALLYGRGSDTGYAGSVAAPVITSSTATTGGTIAAGTYAVVVTAKTGFGETAVSNNTAQVTTGSTSTITVTVATEPNGALNYNLYVSQAGGAVGTATFQTNFSGNTFTLTTAPTSTGAVNAGATNTSADVNSYDGLLTVQTDPTQSGYVKRINAKLSTTNPGDEFQQALLSLYQSVKADPDQIWCDANVMKETGDLLKTSSSANYRLTVPVGDGTHAAFGAVITGIQNQVTTKMVDLAVHPYMPIGCALIRSMTLPVPDSEVSNTVEVVNVQDYMAVDWPVVQFTYDQSTYWYGAPVHYAPAWSGALLGIQ